MTSASPAVVKSSDDIEMDLTKGEDAKTNLLVAGLPRINEGDIHVAFSQIQGEETAKLIGLICHLAHWRVFGVLNPLPLDSYHLKQLFIAITGIHQRFESKHWGKRKGVFRPFIMPMIILAVRIEVIRIFKQTFEVFFSKP